MTSPFTTDASSELGRQLLDVHSALTLIIAAAHMAANHEDLVDVGDTVDAIEQLARGTAARVWALQEDLPPELANWQPGDEPPAASDAPARLLRAVPAMPESAS